MNIIAWLLVKLQRFSDVGRDRDKERKKDKEREEKREIIRQPDRERERERGVGWGSSTVSRKCCWGFSIFLAFQLAERKKIM